MRKTRCGTGFSAGTPETRRSLSSALLCRRSRRAMTPPVRANRGPSPKAGASNFRKPRIRSDRRRQVIADAVAARSGGSEERHRRAPLPLAEVLLYLHDHLLLLLVAGDGVCYPLSALLEIVVSAA